MKLTLHLDATFFDCILRIRCENGFNVAYRMTATAPLGSNLIDTVTVEVPENICEVMVYPQFCEGLKVEGFLWQDIHDARKDRKEKKERERRRRQRQERVDRNRKAREAEKASRKAKSRKK